MNEAWCKDERTALVYQVVESLANDFGITDDPAIRNFLDLLVYGKSENPVLPFPKFTHLQDTINQHKEDMKIIIEGMGRIKAALEDFQSAAI